MVRFCILCEKKLEIGLLSEILLGFLILRDLLLCFGSIVAKLYDDKA